MKTSLTILSLLVALNAVAQSVDRNDVVISVSPGVSYNYFENKDSTGPFGRGVSHFGIRTPVSVEYVFNREIGISADFNHTRLFASTFHPSNITLLDFGAGLSFHSPSNKRRFNWFGKLGLHYSRLHYFYHGDITHHTTDASGFSIYSDAGVNMPLSANEKFGMGLQVNASAYAYTSAHDENSYGGVYDFKMNAQVFSFGLNFYYKL